MKLWPFRTTVEVEPPFELSASRGIVDTSRDLTDAEQAAVLELFDEPDELRRQLDEVIEQRDQLVAALDWQRPAPNPHILATVLEKQWWKAPDGLNTTQQWIRIAETAIDFVRGLWPLDPSPLLRCENCNDPAGHVARGGALSPRRWCVACEVALDPTGRTAWRIPQNVAGSHEKAVQSPADSAGEPAPGDPNATGNRGAAARVAAGEPVPGGTYAYRPNYHFCGLCGAVASLPMSSRGWCPTCEQHDQHDLAERVDQLVDHLASVMAEHEQKHTGMPWDRMPETWRDQYRDTAAAVLLAGWRPSTTGATR